MKKTNLLILLCLLIASQAFAQQPQSFAEYWFGVKPQKNVQRSTKSLTQKSVAKPEIRSATSASGIITLDLSNPLNPSSFEVDANGVWTQTYNDEDYTFFETNSPFAFSHILDGPGAAYGGYYWDGFTYSKNGKNTDYGQGSSQSWIANQWGNMAGGGIKTDAEGNVLKDQSGVVLTDPEAPYLVAYWGFGMEPEYFYTIYYGVNLTEPAHNLQTLFTDGNTYEAVGVYVNNHPWPYYGNINGDGFASAFGEGDYFKLIIHGLDADWNETGKSVEHMLAEYKDGQLIQSSNWEWVDLSSLGEIGGLYYTLETTDADPTYGPNTACYFCMDKLQIKAVQEQPEVTITMNSVSRTMVLRNKQTDEIVDAGSPTNYAYTFNAAPGEYTLYAYGSDGETLNGTIELTITDEETQQFQFYTITTYATNSGWTLGTDYTINATVLSRESAERVITLGSSVTANRATFLTCSGDTYLTQFIPSEDRLAQGYLNVSSSGTITANVTASKSIPVGYTYTITAPAAATVYLGFPNYSGYFFRPFTEIIPSDVTPEGDNIVYTYTIAGGQECIYRISQTDKITYARYFSKANSEETLTVTEDMLEGDPKTVDHNVGSNSGFNVSDIFLNINEKGHLRLSSGDNFQIVNIRAWQTNNSITANKFIEPDFHYTVVNENGVADASVVTVNEKGLLTAIGSGTAIVLVTYDAINVTSAAGGPFFSAIWPENTGVFVVSVDAEESGITPNMTINEVLNASSDKNAGIYIDAEMDVFYYLEENGGYDYTFTPDGVTTVSLAQPVVGKNIITYNGFNTDNVTDNGDGSYTVRLLEGRNIVKMTSATGDEYQVLTAKSVSYTITNASHEGDIIEPGDKVSIRFSTIYHPATKLAGVYNMNAYMQYTANESTIIGTGSQYAFANTANCQTITVTIPTEWDIKNDFTLTGGIIRVGGISGLNYGDPFGNHRLITLETGRNPNFTASLRLGYFGALPDIQVKLKNITTGIPDVLTDNEIAVYPNPFTDYLIVRTICDSEIRIFNISGHCVLNTTVKAGETRIETSILPKGTYMVKCGEKVMKIVK